MPSIKKCFIGFKPFPFDRYFRLWKYCQTKLTSTWYWLSACSIRKVISFFRTRWPPADGADQPVPARKPVGDFAAGSDQDQPPQCPRDQPKQDPEFTGRDWKPPELGDSWPQQQPARGSTGLDRKPAPAPEPDPHQEQPDPGSEDHRELEITRQVEELPITICHWTVICRI